MREVERLNQITSEVAAAIANGITSQFSKGDTRAALDEIYNWRGMIVSTARNVAVQVMERCPLNE